MRMDDMYRLAVMAALKVDPRHGADMNMELERNKIAYEKLKTKDKERFDVDSLWNPYDDSRILYGDGECQIKRAVWGIDISPAEVVLVDRLKEKGQQIDAILSHHPQGKARANLFKVMRVQENMMESWGVPITAAEWIMGPRMKEVQYSMHSLNHNESVDACRMLDIPFMCIHSPADMLGQRFMQDLMDKETPERLNDVLEILSNIPEYDVAIRNGNAPEIYVGGRDSRAGVIATKFAGGTAAPKEMYEQLSRAGVGTVICMHVPDSHIEEARKNKINIVVASHMASDSIGLNLLSDMFENNGVSIVPCSGFIRVKRN